MWSNLVIVSNTGEIDSIVKKEKLGIVIEPESTISLVRGIEEFLAKKDELSKDIWNRAIRYAKPKDWRIMRGKIRSSYIEGLKSISKCIEFSDLKDSRLDKFYSKGDGNIL